MAITEAYRCPACEDLFEEPVALYECSRCGGEVPEDETEDRRCPECHIFMAKAADAACPGCHDPDPEQVEAWRGEDGQLYESEQAERDWIAEAPARAAKAAEGREWMRRHMEEYAAECRATNAALAPKLRRLIGLIAGRMPVLEDQVRWQLAGIERDPETSAGLVADLKFNELAAVFAAHLPEDLRTSVDRDLDYEDRIAVAGRLREPIVAAFEGTPLVDRMRDSWYLPGNGLGYPILDAIDPLLAVLEREAGERRTP